MFRVAVRRRVGDPDIQLERSVTMSAHLLDPGKNFLGLHQQHTTRAEAAGIRDSDRQRRGARTGHGCQQNGKT